MAHKDSVSASEVKELLYSRRGEWPTVAAEAKVSYSWISKFVNGHIPNPGYETLLALRNHLAASQKKQEA